MLVLINKKKYIFTKMVRKNTVMIKYWKNLKNAP